MGRASCFACRIHANATCSMLDQKMMQDATHHSSHFDFHNSFIYRYNTDLIHSSAKSRLVMYCNSSNYRKSDIKRKRVDGRMLTFSTTTSMFALLCIGFVDIMHNSVVSAFSVSTTTRSNQFLSKSTSRTPLDLNFRVGVGAGAGVPRSTRLTAAASAQALVERLKNDVEQLANNDNEIDETEVMDEEAVSNMKETIKITSAELEEMFSDNDNDNANDDDDSKRFEPLLGLYDVSHVQTSKEGDNPVGGKWTRKNKLAQQLFSTRRTLQHLVPTNSTGNGLLKRKRNDGNGNGNGDGEVVAEAVNVISLDAFFKLVRLNVILRGDAVPLTLEERNSPKMSGKLSNLAVRAFFDAPRIILGKGRFVNLQLGPVTSVVLDATYVDDKVRIGKGGVSGTKFIFFRCKKDDQEAMEFQSLLQTRKTRTSKVLAVIGAVGGSAVWASISSGSIVLGGSIGIVAALSAAAIAFSSGGVEEDDNMDGNVLD